MKTTALLRTSSMPFETILIIMMHSQYHLVSYETPENFCMWFKNSLASHSLSCQTCDSTGFDGCISYDGVSITVCWRDATLSVSPGEFAEAGYRH
ncbi:hypothetical protein P692DRAFT_20436204 [Suillus brevipes Sb2]|nr:hypothetical protein P692DRAFT_20436204 [Suillus brevipes Sb2]